MNVNDITSIILEKAIKVHKASGPGLLGSAYKGCLAYELIETGLLVEKEKPLPLIYEEVKLDCGYRVDLYAERLVVVEIKSAEAIPPVYVAQILTYLKLVNNKIGLLINFNVVLF